ncbi:MAG: M28 family peptidase [Candidatus Abyssobacteria bacterium SURF_5]|uniref:M28 family peptidase n=1 Tax=Abyssobacteria bacterium (strain SURF_5) TaxID=2093360 RepID=A0A3A4P7H8_ABYX5|nr:MAG: M28 family peptidase [Candidatus Abyssubacteria bacterium SURF_5]
MKSLRIILEIFCKTSALALLAVLCALLTAGYLAFKPTNATAERTACSFNGNRAFEHLRSLVKLGPRVPGTPAAARAQDYILNHLRVNGVDVKEQPFEARTPLGTKKMKNIIGVLPGLSSDVIIVGAHYDTKLFNGFEFVGANDGASGTAVLLELSQCLQPKQTGTTLWLVFFDGEEAFVKWSPADSLYGSNHYVDRLQASGEIKNVKAMILLDMVGDSHLSIETELYSTRWLRNIVWNTAERMGYQKQFTTAPAWIQNDHLPFLKRKIPALNIIDFHYGPASRTNEFWHSPEDTLDKVNPESLQIIGDVVVASLPQITVRMGKYP